MTTKTPFDKHRKAAYPFKFCGELAVRRIAGGVPSDPKKAEGWLKSKLDDKDNIIREMVAETMIERGIDAGEAAEHVASLQGLNGFKRNGHGLYIEGRQLKAAIKEAGSVAVAAGKLKQRGWGNTNKGIQKFLAEHVFVMEDELPLGANEPTRIEQHFPHTFRGTSIEYVEVLDEARVCFTLITDQDLAEKEWAMIWLTGEQEGIGAKRSQGYGRYTIVKWERISA